MKKLLSVFCTIALFGAVTFQVVSCTQIDDEDLTETTELTFDIKVINASSPNTKVVKTDWEDGDKILVFFWKNGASSSVYSNKYLTLTYNKSNKSWSQTITGLSSSNLGSSGTMYAVYFPFGNVTPLKDSRWSNMDSYRFFYSSGNTNPALDNYPAFSFYLIDKGSGYNASGTTVTGTLTMKLPENFVYFYIDAANGKYNENEKYRLSVEGVKPATVLNWERGSFNELKLADGLPMWGYKYGDGIAFAGIIDDSWASEADHKFIFFSDGDPAVTKTFHDISLSSHQSVKLKEPTASNGWNRYMMAPEYEEIAGIKWSKWFLGSTSEDDVTNLHKFRWAEIVPDMAKDDFDQLPIHDLTDDDYTTGTASYAIFDPARAILGADWRMPNRADFNSLVSNCTLTSNTSWFTFTSGDKSIKFASSIATSIYMWTSQQAGTTYIYVREYHSGENKLSETASGTSESPKRQFGNNYIRPIYIGE